ncbi:hypothetical protein CQA53_11270, partial [Helicobacter didelphidarum]
EWHKSYKYDKEEKKYIETKNFANNTLNLYNDFVDAKRHILIHDGFSPKNSDGCLLIKSQEVKDEQGNIVDNILAEKAYKKLALGDAIINNKGFIRKFLNDSTTNTKNFVKNNICIVIKNNFT